MMDGLHVNAMAGNESGRDTARLADFDETPQGHFYDPDAEYEPDPSTRPRSRRTPPGSAASGSARPAAPCPTSRSRAR